MKVRCYDPKGLGFAHYGHRGIVVCDRWKHSFENFHEDMGDPPPNMTIDRIDNDGNYEPKNCRWATDKQQMRNRQNTRFLTHNGITLSVPDWADKIGIDRNSLGYRIRTGWSVHRALTTPPRQPTH
jgi:hypothetical protein